MPKVLKCEESLCQITKSRTKNIAFIERVCVDDRTFCDLLVK